MQSQIFLLMGSFFANSSYQIEYVICFFKYTPYNTWDMILSKLTSETNVSIYDTRKKYYQGPHFPSCKKVAHDGNNEVHFSTCS